MPALVILKLGTTHAATMARYGDFDRWTTACLGPTTLPVRVVDVAAGEALPEPSACAGVVATGAHAMVTDDLPWSVAVERWLPGLVTSGVPFLGICYGHQLLARALGGAVGFHPAGKEIGTVEVRLTPAAAQDPLCRRLPRCFAAHATHSQTVLRLPPAAVRLAANDHEPHHAFRVGACAWGVQFHPEHHPGIVHSYIETERAELTAAGLDVPALLAGVRDTPRAAELPRHFAAYCAARPGGACFTA